MSESFNCKCGNTIKYLDKGSHLQCPICSDSVAIHNGIIRFYFDESEQSKLFDSIYASGYNNIEQKNTESIRDEYLAHAPTALNYLVKAGYDITQNIEGISILDAACGSGWTSAAFYNHPNICGCHIHAFDISYHGVKRLKDYLSDSKNNNSITYSTQNALSMCFAEEQFDLVVGSSILHHFDDYKAYLKGCLHVLKPNGKAIFGEPFAVGYGLIYSAMKIATNELKIKSSGVDSLYLDASKRIEHFENKEGLSNLVDKHLFHYDEMVEAGRAMGFTNCDIIPVHQLEYMDGHLIDELYNDMGIDNKKLRSKTKSIYKVIFDIFRSQGGFTRTLSPFNYIVFEK